MHPPECFRKKAAEARALAQEMAMWDARMAMLSAAEKYEYLAYVAEKEDAAAITISAMWASLLRPS